MVVRERADIAPRKECTHMLLRRGPSQRGNIEKFWIWYKKNIFFVPDPKFLKKEACKEHRVGHLQVQPGVHQRCDLSFTRDLAVAHAFGKKKEEALDVREHPTDVMWWRGRREIAAGNRRWA